MSLATIFVRLSTFSKDARRIALFLAACQVKALELAETDPVKVSEFAQASAVLMAEWVPEPKKLSLSWLFGDPYKPHREKVRRFADFWQLDETFREEMG